MTYANIKLTQHQCYNRNDNTKFDQKEQIIFPFIKPMIEALALKYPQWEFVEIDARVQWEPDGTNWYAADGFKVMDKREELGRIRVDHWCRAGKRFWIENFRIDAQRQRGSGFKTKHMDKAIKHVSKYFGSMNHAELIAVAEENAHRIKGGILNGLQSEHRANARNIEEHIYQFVLENHYDAFAAWTRQHGFWRKEVDLYPETQRAWAEGCKINKLIHDGKALLVNIVNSDYIVKQGEAVSILSSEQLPDKVRRNLGLLKLVQDRELISNVGIRVDESTYYVIGENNE